jgi:hypothetical protein
MHVLNHLVVQARHQEIARAANDSTRLVAHELRLARRTGRA